MGANSSLPDDISVTWVQRVDDAFHARFSATARSYRYRILNRLQRSALHRNRAWWVYQALDSNAMHEAAQRLLGRHDFLGLSCGTLPGLHGDARDHAHRRTP